NKQPQRVAATGSDLYTLLNSASTQQPSRPILFKMHGSVDKVNAGNDSYLITEEDYVDFLGRAGGSYSPPYVNALMEGKDFLFLGYSLEDWNVRVILRKLLKRATNRDVRVGPLSGDGVTLSKGFGKRMDLISTRWTFWRSPLIWQSIYDRCFQPGGVPLC